MHSSATARIRLYPRFALRLVLGASTCSLGLLGCQLSVVVVVISLVLSACSLGQVGWRCGGGLALSKMSCVMCCDLDLLILAPASYRINSYLTLPRILSIPNPLPCISQDFASRNHAASTLFYPASRAAPNINRVKSGAGGQAVII